MAYFPAFIKLDQQKILIVGGGNIAYEKLERLLDFSTDITVIASKLSQPMHQKILKEGLNFKEQPYNLGDIKGYDIVIIAVDDISLQAAIYQEARAYRCLCNAVDSVDYCDFIFPSYIKKDDLTIAVSTSGASPALAKHLRRFLQELIPDTISEFLKEMKTLRSTLPKGKERMKLLDNKAQEYLKTWRNESSS